MLYFLLILITMVAHLKCVDICGEWVNLYRVNSALLGILSRNRIEYLTIFFIITVIILLLLFLSFCHLGSGDRSE